MSDIATLGIAVDSRQVTQATSALSGLAAAAKPATSAVNEHSAAHAGLSTQAMAAQHSIRSMIEGLAQGMPVTQVLSQQLNHLSYAATGPGGISGAFKSAGSALLGLLSPTTLVVGGLAALGIAGGLAVHSIAETEKKFDDVSRSIGTTVEQLHALDSAAAFKGIDTPDFLKGMEKFSASVYDAKNNMGGLAEVFRANNTTASSFTDYLEKAANLIQRAQGDTGKQFALLQQMGLPATMEWVKFLQQGADGIRAAALEATKFSPAAQDMAAKAREFDDAWAKATKNLGTGIRNAVVEGASWLQTLSEKGTALLMKLNSSVPTNILRNAMNDNAAGYNVGSKLSATSSVDDFYKGLGSNAPGNGGPKPVDPAVLQKQISLQQQYIGMLGQTASIEQVGTAVSLQAQAARLQGVNISKEQVATLKTLAQENALGITAIKASTDAQRIDAQVVGMSVGAAAEYTAKQNALNQAKREGRPLTQDNIDQISREASALGQAAANADNMKFAYEGLVRGPMQAFQQALANGAGFFGALKAAGLSALNALSSKLMDMAAQNLWKAALGGGSGGGLLSLLGMGGGASTGGVGGGNAIPTLGAAGDYAVPTFATGGYTGPGGKNQAAGIVHAGEYVMDAATTSRLGVPFLNSLRGYADGGFVDSAPSMPAMPKPANGNSPGGGGVHISIPQTLNFYGSDPASEARMRAYVDQNSKQTVQEAVRQVGMVRGAQPAYLRGGR